MTDQKPELKYPVTSFYCDPDTKRGLGLLIIHFCNAGSLDGERVTQSSTIRKLVKDKVHELGLEPILEAVE